MTTQNHTASTLDLAGLTSSGNDRVDDLVAVLLDANSSADSKQGALDALAAGDRFEERDTSGPISIGDCVTDCDGDYWLRTDNIRFELVTCECNCGCEIGTELLWSELVEELSPIRYDGRIVA